MFFKIQDPVEKLIRRYVLRYKISDQGEQVLSRIIAFVDPM